MIGIVSLLMAVTSSALHSVREQADATMCGTNIRHLYVLLDIYSTDNERFPRSWVRSFGGTIGSLGHDLPAIWWFQSIGLEPQESDIAQRLLQCPSKQLPFFLKYNVLWGNYGVNWSVCASNKFVLPAEFRDTTTRSLSPTQIKHPAELFLVGDSGYTALGWQHVVTPAAPFAYPMNALATSYIPGLSTNKDREELTGVQQDDAQRGRHPGHSVNVGFADGHVAKKRADDLSVEQTAEGHYTNRTPLWKPR